MKLSMSPEFRAEVGSRWALALWVFQGSLFSMGELQELWSSAQLWDPCSPGALHTRDWAARWDYCWDRGQDFGKHIVGGVFQNLTWAPAGILEQSTSLMDHQGRVTERGGCCQRLIHHSQVTQQGARGALGGGGNRDVPCGSLGRCPGASGAAPPSQQAGHQGWHGVSSLFSQPEPFEGNPTLSASIPLLNTWMQHLRCHSKY